MALLQLSQSHLTLIEQCPRKFQYIYLDQIAAPLSPEQQEHLTRGSRVHHLMQQHELKLSLNGTHAGDRSFEEPNTHHNRWTDSQAQLYQMADALAAGVPPLGDATVFRQSEYRLNLDWSGTLLTVIYDLLLLDTAKAYIFDWKTYLSPPNLEQLRQQLTHHWQTKLYPFVLVETSHYLPNDVTLAYWFVRRKDTGDPHSYDERLHNNQTLHPLEDDSLLFEPECLTFPYSDRLHHQTKQELTQVIEQVQHWIDGYSFNHPLPKVDVSKGLCSQCPFKMRCDRLDESTGQENWDNLEDITAIPEIQPFLSTKQTLGP